ncbi:response regulator transcription factor [Thermicanus aegyptius]|uniref:response regulator transcription factor n=1 Tax=Thermicanus aegyptius TaxID=94009 RepID=UPI0003FF1920|nr:LuxR C-terminal-related transcriptional regulator [Thermicanus aegyptius]
MRRALTELLFEELKRDESLQPSHIHPLQKFITAYALTERERDLLYAICLFGFSNEKIGELFNISPHTVKNHISKILIKMNARSIREVQAALFRYLISEYEPCERNKEE